MITEEKISEDLTLFDPKECNQTENCKLMSLEEVAKLIISPDTRQILNLDDEQQFFLNKSEKFPILRGLPILFPKKYHEFLGETSLEIPMKIYDDPFLQYIFISSIKFSSGINNLPVFDPWAQRHYYRAKTFLQDMIGNVLDIGCDSIEVSRSIFPNETEYVGLDLFFDKKNNFRIIGVGEFLPFANESFDNVTLMTSLDHIFDYHRAIDEAFRVLKVGGRLYLATLIWQDNAELYHDNHHFHHFREYEILGVLNKWKIEKMKRYTWKNASHRHSLYLCAKKGG